MGEKEFIIEKGDKGLKLNYIVPLEYFEYIGRNKPDADGWTTKEFYKDINDNILLDEQLGIYLKRFICSNDISEINARDFSEEDRNRILQTMWGLYFSCQENQLKKYKEVINLLFLSIRIFFKKNTGSQYILCQSNPTLSHKYNEEWKYAIAEKQIIPEEELNDYFTRSNIEELINAFNKLKQFWEVSDRARHSVQFLFLGYTTYYWMASFVLFVTSLETLVSPDIIGDISTYVKKRTVAFIKDTNVCSNNKMDNLYKLRSNIVHGRIRVKLDLDKEIKKIQQLQIIVLTFFKKLLEENFASIYKDEESKEAFLNKIAPLNKSLPKICLDTSCTKRIIY